MTEKKIPEVFTSERFQLANTGANIAVAKLQLCMNCQDQMGAHSAGKWALKYYDIALGMLNDAFAELEENEEDGDETIQLHNNVDPSTSDESSSEGD